MDFDADDIFRDDSDDSDNELYQERSATKELVVYLVDASPKMFSTTSPSGDGEDVSDFHVAVSCISESLRSQIINSSYNEVAICFFNTREKRNLQDLNGVYVFNVAERDNLDRPTARIIKEVSNVEGGQTSLQFISFRPNLVQLYNQLLESFMSKIGSQYGINSGSRENSLYNALWVAQALLRKGSTRTADKRVLLFTNEDDPFGSIKGITKTDMMRTTLQRAKDAQDLGISIELLPLCHPDNEFNVSTFYSDLVGLSGDELSQFMPEVGEKWEDMKNQIRRRMFKKRIIRKITFSIANGFSIQLSSYALIRPTNPGAITWLDSVTNRPLKAERSFVCSDTGALIQESVKRFQPYKNENIKFSVEELSEIKRISTGQLRLLGFKPLNCLKEYHNLRPSTFLFPSDQEVMGSTCVFIALHNSMLRLKRFAVAFYGSSSRPQLVALVSQDEIVSSSGQVEPPGMHMIYLPYCDDIRHAEELLMGSDAAGPHASDDQIKEASIIINRLSLKDYSVFQFSNPGLQRHYAVLQALALDEDDIPEIKDETSPPVEAFSRPAVVRLLEEFKHSVYGENYDEESEVGTKANETTKKRKAAAELAAKEISKHDWADLADNGKLKNLTVVELKCYLTANNLPVAGKKEALISRILTHMGK